MAIRAQDVGQDVRVVRIALAARGAVAGARGLHDVGMHRIHGKPGVHEGIDEEPRRALDCDRERGRLPEPPQLGEQFGEAGGRVLRGELGAYRPALVHDTDRVLETRPVQSEKHPHQQHPPFGWYMVSAVGRSGRSLISWRSRGGKPGARHPVAGRDLPASSAPQVSSGPLTSEPTRQSPTKPWSHRPLPSCKPEHKSNQRGEGTVMSRYRFVEAEKGRYPVTRLCRMAQVSRAAYYQWQEGRGSVRQAADAALTAAIRAIHVASVKDHVTSFPLVV